MTAPRSVARHLLLAFSLLIAATPGALVPAPAGAPQPTPPPGFTALFNGRDFSGWHGMEHFDARKLAAMSDTERRAFIAARQGAFEKHWRVEHSELVNDGDGPYATTDRDYGDIELRLEYRTVAKADSGIYLRGTPQVQIWDTTEEGGKWNLGADKGSGGLWNNSAGAPGKEPLVKADKPFGEWNSVRVVQVGEITSVWLNDQLVVDRARMENFWDRKTPLRAKGPIQLQTHGGEIRWRNVVIREIPSDEATRYLAEREAADFTPIFNGKDWAGWKGPVENYEVTKDGTIRCGAGKGGTIFTADEYGDFAVRLEFKLPPGGNNGLAIRYPGHGDAAYVGMSEMQVLDNTAAKYATLDPRQAHGSAYGMAAAHPGFLRPVGDWNIQDVIVRGSRIQVELNGTRILDVDLAVVTDYMDGMAHPGKNRARGHFGFAGHNDPVEYRNIRMRPLR